MSHETQPSAKEGLVLHLNGRYRLDLELGRGGTSTVYRAHDTLLDRDVAVKVLSEAGLSSKRRARLLIEAKVVARLNHPNIVAVYDAGEVDGSPFIVMEWVNGTSRHDHRADRWGPLPPSPPLSPQEERLRLFDCIARFFQSLAVEHGRLLFVDDLHWADQGTLALLRYLLLALRDDRVLFLATYRDTELDRTHPLAAALVEWNRERGVTRLSLGRLAARETAELLAGLFGAEQVTDEFSEAIYHETEGNPFFVEEVVKALLEQGQIYRGMRSGIAWRLPN